MREIEKNDYVVDTTESKKKHRQTYAKMARRPTETRGKEKNGRGLSRSGVIYANDDDYKYLLTFRVDNISSVFNIVKKVVIMPNKRLYNCLQ